MAPQTGEDENKRFLKQPASQKSGKAPSKADFWGRSVAI